MKLEKEDGETVYLEFFDSADPPRNRYQVTQQVKMEGSYKNRYDVTILVNGLPLVQIELKRRGLEMKEAFNQIQRYQKHTFWSGHGLFHFVQLFVISNGVNTKYYANARKQSFKQTFYWAQEDNTTVRELVPFADAFLNREHLGTMIGKYIVLNETDKILIQITPKGNQLWESDGSDGLEILLCGSERQGVYGAPGEIRTPDHLVRSQVLYPAELRAL